LVGCAPGLSCVPNDAAFGDQDVDHAPEGDEFTGLGHRYATGPGHRRSARCRNEKPKTSPLRHLSLRCVTAAAAQDHTRAGRPGGTASKPDYPPPQPEPSPPPLPSVETPPPQLSPEPPI